MHQLYKRLKNFSIGTLEYSAYLAGLYGLYEFYDGDAPWIFGVSLIPVGGYITCDFVVRVFLNTSLHKMEDLKREVNGLEKEVGTDVEEKADENLEVLEPVGNI